MIADRQAAVRKKPRRASDLPAQFPSVVTARETLVPHDDQYVDIHTTLPSHSDPGFAFACVCVRAGVHVCACVCAPMCVCACVCACLVQASLSPGRSVALPPPQLRPGQFRHPEGRSGCSFTASPPPSRHFKRVTSPSLYFRHPKNVKPPATSWDWLCAPGERPGDPPRWPCGPGPPWDLPGWPCGPGRCVSVADWCSRAHTCRCVHYAPFTGHPAVSGLGL